MQIDYNIIYRLFDEVELPDKVREHIITAEYNNTHMEAIAHGEKMLKLYPDYITAFTIEKEYKLGE